MRSTSQAVWHTAEEKAESWLVRVEDIFNSAQNGRLGALRFVETEPDALEKTNSNGLGLG